MKTYLAELNKRRDLVLYLVVSGLKAQHRNTTLGYLWWLLDPLLNTLIYYVVVVVLFGRGGPGYGVHLIVGLIVWRWLGAAVATSSRAIVSQSNIITQVSLPKIVFPITTTLTSLANFAFGLLVVMALISLMGHPPGWTVIWLPLVVATQLSFTLCLSAAVAYMCVFVRDTDALVGHAMRLWFYGSPVIWSESMVPEAFHWIIALNPMTHVLSAYRAILLENHSPNALPLVAIAISSSAAIAAVMFFYSRHEHRIIKAL